MNTRRYIAFGEPYFGDDEVQATARVLRLGWIGLGAETEEFEQELAHFLGARHVVCVSSCTDALFLSLRTLGVGPGDEVICPSLTWCSTANAALYLGATPVLCDIDPHTLCVTVDDVMARVTPRTRAVLPVHYGGHPAPVAALKAALPSGIAVVEDAAHALGSQLPGGERIGGGDSLACFSFYANKNLSTGEGGAIATADGALAQRLRQLRLHGLSQDAWRRYREPTAKFVPDIAELGYKMNFTDLQAVIGRVQLRRQGEFAEHRLAIARLYAERLSSANLGLRFQTGLTEDWHARHLFVVQLPLEHMRDDRAQLMGRMRSAGIGVSIHYAPLHAISLYASGVTRPLPVTDDLAPRLLTLPIGARMSLDEAGYVADTFVAEAAASMNQRRSS